MDTLQVFLVVYDVLLLDYPAAQLQRIFDSAQALPEDVIHLSLGDFSWEVDDFFPGEGDALLSARPELLEEEDDGFEDAAVEDGDGLADHEYFFGFLEFGRVVLVGEEIFPIDEGLVGDQGIVLVIGNFEVSEEFEVLQWSKPLIFIQLYDDLVNDVVIYLDIQVLVRKARKVRAYRMMSSLSKAYFSEVAGEMLCSLELRCLLWLKSLFFYWSPSIL